MPIVKATLCVLGAVGLAAYFAACNSDNETADGGSEAPLPCTGPDAKAGDKCTGGVCLEESAGKFSCYMACTTVGDTCKQTDDTFGTCYVWDAKTGESVCVGTGTSTDDGACGTNSDCLAGEQCLDQGGTKNCYLVCTDTCVTGTCTDTDLGFKVCIATETT